MKILVVEDDKDLMEIITKSLEKERYVVSQAPDYHTALMKAGDYDYDCILLDIMLPDGVIILSAKDSIEDKVKGLDLGADDYLPKPFHLAELHARIKSLLRRNQREGEKKIVFGNIEILPEKFEVSVDGKLIDLNRKEYDILMYFMLRPNRLVNKSTLAESVWGDHIDQVDNFDFIYAQIKNLRKRLKDAGSTPELKAVYGIGYKFVLE